MIFHITTPEQWQAAKNLGYYRTNSLEIEGFIHCSSNSQVMKVAKTFYQDSNDLIVLCVDSEKLTSQVKWEAPSHPNNNSSLVCNQDEKFPHVYGVINLEAVAQIINLKHKGLYQDIILDD